MGEAMLNAAIPIDDRVLRVTGYGDPDLDHLMRHGRVNVDDATIVANISSAIQRGYPQIRPGPPRPDDVCLVGSGPSLAETEDELGNLVETGAKLVTMNGSYHWCLARGWHPKTQIVMDARPSNARFLRPAVPDCRYVLASQCAPDAWDAVAGRPHVWIFHAAYGPGSTAAEALDTFYDHKWWGVGGGITVLTRAIFLLSMCGWSKFHLFGVDSCWRGDAHHAFVQPENDDDQYVALTVEDPDLPGSARLFRASLWQLKQAEDFVTLIRLYGDRFVLNIHGDGLLKYILVLAAQAAEQEDARARTTVANL